MIVDCAVYEQGRRLDGSLAVDQAFEASRRGDAFVWIGLYEPTEEEFDAVRREFDIHELAVEDAIDAHQRPKLEVYGDSLFLVLKTAPLAGRIVALADVFDALTHARPYKPAWPIDETVTEIDRLAGRQFDPAVVDAFGKLDAHELIRAPELLSRLDQVA